MAGEILRPPRWAQVILLFEVGEDARNDEELAHDIRRSVAVTLAGRVAMRAEAVGMMDPLTGMAILQRLTNGGVDAKGGT